MKRIALPPKVQQLLGLTPMRQARKDALFNPALAKYQRDCGHPGKGVTADIDGWTVMQCGSCLFIFSEEPAKY